MKKIKFWKMSGAGNDFVLVSGRYSGARLKKMAVEMCAAKTGIGADGLLCVNKAGKKTVSVRYFNSDGSEAFCGNGSRCAAWWAHCTRLIKARKFDLLTIRDRLCAEVIGPERIKMRMPDVKSVVLGFRGRYPGGIKEVHFLNTGVPHAVVPLNGIDKLDVASLGRALRFNPAFGAAGANVNFVVLDGRNVRIRTYERGVEAETLACGTGITASAIALGLEKGLPVPVVVTARSGERFKVWFQSTGCGASDIYIEGPAKKVFEGTMEVSCCN